MIFSSLTLKPCDYHVFSKRLSLPQHSIIYRLALRTKFGSYDVLFGESVRELSFAKFCLSLFKMISLLAFLNGVVQWQDIYIAHTVHDPYVLKRTKF